MNKVFLLGNIGSDIEKIGPGQNDSTCVKFSLATNKTYKKNGEKVKKTTWHSIKSFSYTANFLLKYAKKGDQILIEGEVNNYQFEKDGIKKYGSEIIASNVNLVSSKNKMAESTVKDELPKKEFADNSEWGGQNFNNANDRYFDSLGDDGSFDFGEA